MAESCLSHSYHAPRYNGCSPENNLACPYFVPREIVYDIAWPHPARLPLGAGWRGTCCAHDEQTPNGANGDSTPMPADALIRDSCNIGYATACPNLPSLRDWDAVRFSVASTTPNHITLCYVCEFAHAPKAHGTLTYDLAAEAWHHASGERSNDATNDARVRRLAASYLQAYRARGVRRPTNTLLAPKLMVQNS
jgi:hypothetical protein